MNWTFFSFLCQQGQGGWTMWPFGPSFGGEWLPTLARYGIALGFLVVIAFFLRFLFGPGGPMRPEEFGTGHIAERKRRKEELKKLKAKFKNGEISAEAYMKKRLELKSDD